MRLYDRVVITKDVAEYSVTAGTEGVWVDVAKGEGDKMAYIIELPLHHPGGIVAIVPPEIVGEVASEKRRLA